MLDIDIPIEFKNGFYWCGDNLYRDQGYAKEAYKIQKFVDSVENTNRVNEFKNNYLNICSIIESEKLNKENLKKNFKRYIKEDIRRNL